MKKHPKQKPYTEDELENFLRESNYIEGEYSKEALDDARKAWDYLYNRKYLDSPTLLKTHRLLMKRLRPDIAGKYRNCNVIIAAQVKKFDGYLSLTRRLRGVMGAMTDPSVIPRTVTDKAKFAKRMHVEFEEIHPFKDGNGRVGRMLYNWHRLKLDLPLKVIKEEDRQDYYKWFRE